MSHIVLLGDSIFDNASYVPGGPPVIEQLRSWLGHEWQATLLAEDGAICSGVPNQLVNLPPDATHLCISAGGNDALMASPVVHDEILNASQGFDKIAIIQQRFRVDFESMLTTLLSQRLPTIVCTVYDAVPDLRPRELAGLSLFNDVIINCATEHALPIIDLRRVCQEHADYSSVSPIEPSEIGGAKIVGAIKNVLLEHDFTYRRTTVYID